MILAMPSADAWSQKASSIVLRGTVVENDSEEPIVGAHVFVSGTTVGGATDRYGRFEFRYDNPPIEFDLVASIIGFLVEVRSLEAAALSGSDIEFVLSPRVYELGGVVVTSNNREWQQNLERFKKLIFSSTENGRECKILNPEILDFAREPETDVLTATASEPLKVENGALGYRITIHEPHLRGTETGLIWGGEMQFEELTPQSNRQRRRWSSARRLTYEGSAKHFFNAVVSDKLFESGYSVFSVERPGLITNKRTNRAEIILNPPVIENEADPSVLRFFSFEGVLMVRYNREMESKRYADYVLSMGLRERTGMAFSDGSRTRMYQISWLEPHAGAAMIDHRGIEYGDVSMERFGYWSWERLGEMLPADFDTDDL